MDETPLGVCNIKFYLEGFIVTYDLAAELIESLLVNSGADVYQVNVITNIPCLDINTGITEYVQIEAGLTDTDGQFNWYQFTPGHKTTKGYLLMFDCITQKVIDNINFILMML